VIVYCRLFHTIVLIQNIKSYKNFHTVYLIKLIAINSVFLCRKFPIFLFFFFDTKRRVICLWTCRTHTGIY